MPHNANDRQVDGTHYAKHGKLQHWDCMILYSVPYIIGNATKYLWRWKDKNGVKDLEKALHYIEKALECHPSQQLNVPINHETLTSWEKHFGWDEQTSTIIRGLLCPGYRNRLGELEVSRGLLQTLIARETHRSYMDSQTNTWSSTGKFDGVDGAEPTAAQLHPG